MKRLLVRASALAGLLAVSVLAVYAHRAAPQAQAQELQAPTPKTPAKKKSKAKSANPRGKARSASSNRVVSPAADDQPQERYADRYADRYGDRSADSGATPDPNKSDSSLDSSAARGPALFPGAGAGAASPGEHSVYGGRRGVSFDASSTDERGLPDEAVSDRAGDSLDSTENTISRYDSTPHSALRTPHSPPARPERDPFGDAAIEDGAVQYASAIEPAAGIIGTGRPGEKQLEGEQAPWLTIEKSAADEIQIGTPAIFAIRVRNVGEVAAHGVEVHDEIPHGTELLEARPQAASIAAGRVVWKIGTLKPGDETIVEMELMPTAEGEIGSVASVYFASQAAARTRSTRPQLALDVTVPSEVLVGENVKFSIKVSNPGTGKATGVVLTENIPEQLDHPAGAELEYEIGELKPGESRQVDLTMSAVKAGRVLNQLTARGDGQLQVQRQTQFMVVAPQLELSMKGPKRRYLDRQATYTVTVSNPGTAPAKEVQLVTHLPKGMQFVGANNSGEYDPETNSVHWALAELPAQQTGEVTLTALPIEPGEQMLRVESVAERGLAAEQQEVVVVEGVAAILFQLADVDDPIEVGGETTYEIRVVNQGSKAASNVQVVAIFPRELKPRTAKGPTRYTVEGQQVRFQPLGRLAPKDETVYQVRAQGLAPGDLRVQVQLMTDEMQSPVTKEESTRVFGDE